mmetsp:Transcript_13172/g.28654  ORF Transcript_13172/g.28654 Transcript_13172/m.28654 type:complete len:383 (+) Transcript_13172:90-1238(+)
MNRRLTAPLRRGLRFRDHRQKIPSGRHLPCVKATMTNEKSAKPVVRGKGKGNALNQIAAASGRDPAAIVKSVADAEKSAKAEAKKKEETQNLAEQEGADDDLSKDDVPPAQRLYNSLTLRDRYRFECFRRCGFASDPISRHVARCLVEEAERRYTMRQGTISSLGVGQMNPTLEIADSSGADDGQSTGKRKMKSLSNDRILREESKRRRVTMSKSFPYLTLTGKGNPNTGTGEGNRSFPPLDHLVLPGAAPDIVSVVSTLAKAYCQRLVSAGRRVADAERETEQDVFGPRATELEQSKSASLKPRHYLAACHFRKRMDGFWMSAQQTGNSGVSSSAEAAALGRVNRNHQAYLAALASQDSCNKEIEDDVSTETDGMDVEPQS